MSEKSSRRIRYSELNSEIQLFKHLQNTSYWSITVLGKTGNKVIVLSSRKQRSNQRDVKKIRYHKSDKKKVNKRHIGRADRNQIDYFSSMKKSV